MPQQSQARRSSAPPPPENGIECTPTGCAQMCATCLMFLLSLTTISALGVIAGGAFWSAQALNRMTDGENRIQVSLCGAPHNTNTSTHIDFVNHEDWQLTKSGMGNNGIPLCPQFHTN